MISTNRASDLVGVGVGTRFKVSSVKRLGSLKFLVAFFSFLDLLAHLGLNHNPWVSALDYTFCAGNVLYTFSSNACPGGILFKTPIAIDEPCHCFEGALDIYSSCTNSSDHYPRPPTPSGCMAPLLSPQENWTGDAMVLLPADSQALNMTHVDTDSCFGMPESCEGSPSTTITKKPPKLVAFMKKLEERILAMKLAALTTTTTTTSTTDQPLALEKPEDDSENPEKEKESQESESSSGENKENKKAGDLSTTTEKPGQKNDTETTLKPATGQLPIQTLSSDPNLKIGSVINLEPELDLNPPNTIEIEGQGQGQTSESPQNDPKLTLDRDLMDQKFRNDTLNDDIYDEIRLARKEDPDEPNGTTTERIDEKADDKDDDEDTSDESDEIPPGAMGDGAELKPEVDQKFDPVALLRHVQGVKEGRIPDPPPNTKTFQLIQQSMRIVQKIVSNKVIKHVNLLEAYLAFRYMFSALDEDERTDRHFNDNVDDFRSIQLALTDCYNNVPVLAFKTSGSSHKIEAIYIPQESGVTEDLIPSIPEDRAHNPDNEDDVIGIMWKIVDIVHSACFSEFNINSPQTQFDYLVAIEDVFLQPQVQKIWNEPQILTKETETKLQLITTPDVKVLMENLDTIDAAVHSVFDFKFFLKKPKRASWRQSSLKSKRSSTLTLSSSLASKPGKTQRRKRKLPKATPLDERKPRKVLSRKKREETETETLSLSSSPIEVEWDAFEIWEGQAYCLQKENEDLPPSLDNAYPKLSPFCDKLVADNKGQE